MEIQFIMKWNFLNVKVEEVLKIIIYMMKMMIIQEKNILMKI